MHLPPIPRFFARWCIRLAFLVVFVGVPAGILYLREVGIGFGLKERVEEALSGEAFHTTIGRLLFDPFRGLVAENVEVVETTGWHRNLAKVERLVVSVSLGELLNRRISIDLLKLDDTNVSVPLESRPDAPRLDLQGVTAQVLFFANQMRLTSFEGEIQGVRVVLSGLLQNPAAFHLQHHASSTPGPERHEVMKDVIEMLLELKYQGVQPSLRAEITGDLGDLSTLRLSPITLRTGAIVAPRWRIEGLEMDADYENKVFSITRLQIRGREGEGVLNASAEAWDGEVYFEISSSLLPRPFFDLLPADSPVRSLKFFEAPQIDASGKIGFSSQSPRYHAMGSARFGKFAYQGVAFDSLSVDFAARDGQIFARDLRLAASKGELTADILYAPGDFRLRLDNTIAPTVFAPIMGPKEREFLKLMEFRDPPSLQIEVRGTKPHFDFISGSGYLTLGRTALRGSWLDWGKTKIEIADRAVIYRDLSLGSGSGVGTGTFIYDFGRQQAVLENVHSTLDPVEVLMWADPKIAETVKPYRFRANPDIRANGHVHLKNIHDNNLDLKVVADGGMDYDLLGRSLKFGRVLADVDISNGKVNADVKSAKLMGGDLGVKAVVSIDPQNPTFGADVDIRRVNFAQLTKLYFNYDDSLGVGSGRFKFTSRFGEDDKLVGSGNFKVEDGHVFAIPILGPLSDIINRIIPGAGFQTARLATADFTVADGRINTKNLQIQGAGFSLLGRGDIFYTRDRMDMSVRINARGIPGIVLFPVSKLFEYVSTGSASKPEWRPKIIPRFGGGEEN